MWPLDLFCTSVLCWSSLASLLYRSSWRFTVRSNLLTLLKASLSDPQVWCVLSVMCLSWRVKLSVVWLCLTLCLVLQITDFGLSRVAQSVSKCARQKDEDEGGTLSYMPPEALQSVNYKASRASDVYRCNCTHAGFTSPKLRLCDQKYIKTVKCYFESYLIYFNQFFFLHF